MSLLAVCCLILCAVCLLELLRAALKALPEEMAALRNERIEDLQALHAQHFAQLRQALATLDDEYLRRKASGEFERHWHAERRHVIEGFLLGLSEDFGRLERMMKLVQKMSPAEPWNRRWQRADARFRFRANYRLASLQVRSSRLESTSRLARLTELLGNHSAQVEARTAWLAESAGAHSPRIEPGLPLNPK